ncbi:MAG: hypothetical protein HZA46_22510, partial [Planctomycetales bacterium]|nr:hypothetical protein [Planctomycetales bacterium]
MEDRTLLSNSTIQVAVSGSPANEGTGAITYTFSRVGGDANGAVDVTYSIGGTATGADHNGVAGTVTIPDTGNSVNLVVTPVDDTLIEGSETVVVQITTVTNLLDGSDTIDATNTATGIIEDNDTATVSIVGGTTAVTEGAAGVNLQVTLNLTANGVAGTGTLATTVT